MTATLITPDPIRAEVDRLVPGMNPDAARWWATWAALALDYPTAKPIIEATGVEYTTAMSRFARAGLPSIKVYHKWGRVVCTLSAAWHGVPVLAIADRQGVERPALDRVVHDVTGQRIAQWRRAGGHPATELARYLDALVIPYAATWRRFYPLSVAGCRPQMRLVAA